LTSDPKANARIELIEWLTELNDGDDKEEISLKQRLPNTGIIQCAFRVTSVERATAALTTLGVPFTSLEAADFLESGAGLVGEKFYAGVEAWCTAEGPNHERLICFGQR